MTDEGDVLGTLTLRDELVRGHLWTWIVVVSRGRLFAFCDDYDAFPSLYRFSSDRDEFFGMLRRLYSYGPDDTNAAYPLYAPADLPTHLEPYVVAMALSHS